MEMTCPKCHGAMRSYERNGVTVDQCGDCRGIFLDRGELERLIDAEAAYNAPAAAQPSPQAPAYGSPPSWSSPPVPPVQSAPAYGDGYREGRAPAYPPGPRYDSDSGSYRPDDYYRKKKKRSFLEDLFD